MSRRLPVIALDCGACGACCIADWDEPHYVDLLPEDVTRLERAYSSRTIDKLVYRDNGEAESLLTRENTQGHVVCVALRGVVGRKVGCRIYEHRPDVCRDFRPGSQACRSARRTAGLED